MATEEIKEINREDCPDLLQAEVSSLRAEIRELGLKLEKTNDKLIKKKNELEREREISLTFRKLSLQSKQTPAMQPGVSEEFVQRLVMDKRSLESQVYEQKREMESLNTKLTQRTYGQQQIHSDLLLREKQLEDCKSDYLKLQGEYKLGKQLFKEALSSLSAEKEHLLQEMNREISMNQNLCQRIDSLQNKQYLEVQVGELLEAITEYKKRDNQLSNENYRLQNGNRLLYQDLQKLETESKGKIEELRGKQEAQRQSIVNNNKKHSDELQEKEISISKLTKRLETMKTDFAKERDEILKKEDKNLIEKLKSEKSSLEQRVEELTRQNHKLTNERAAVQHEQNYENNTPFLNLVNRDINLHTCPLSGSLMEHKVGSNEQQWECSFCGSDFPIERDRDVHMTHNCPSSPMVPRDDTVLAQCDKTVPLQGYVYNPPLFLTQSRGYQMRPSYPPKATHSGYPSDTQTQGGSYLQWANKERTLQEPPKKPARTNLPQHISDPTHGIVPNLPNPLQRPDDIVPVPLSPTHLPDLVRHPSGPKANIEEPQIPFAKVQSPLSSPGESRVEVVLVWSKDGLTREREITFFDSSSPGHIQLLWSEEKTLYQGNGSLCVGTHSGTLLFPTNGEMLKMRQFEVVRKQMEVGTIKLKLHELYAQEEPTSLMQFSMENSQSVVFGLLKEMDALEKVLKTEKQNSEIGKQLIDKLNSDIRELEKGSSGKNTVVVGRQLAQLEKVKVEMELKLGEMATEIANRDIKIYELEQNIEILETRIQVAQKTTAPPTPNSPLKTKDDKKQAKPSKDQPKQKQAEPLPATPGGIYEELTPQIVPLPNKSGKPAIKLAFRPGRSVNVVKLKSLPTLLECYGKQVISLINKIYELGVLVVIFETPGKIGFKNVTQKFAGINLYNPVGNSGGEFRTKRYFKCDLNCGIFVPFEDVFIPVI